MSVDHGRWTSPRPLVDELRMCYRLRATTIVSAMSSEELREYHGLSEGYWTNLGPEGRALYALVRPVPKPSYTIDVQLSRLRGWVEQTRADQERAGGGLELCPDFQRGHVWTQAQRVAFCESFVRGQASALLLFNCPSFNERLKTGGDLNPEMMQCFDGLQRLTALCGYADNELAIYGGKFCRDLDGSPFSAMRLHVQVRVFSMRNRAELLTAYLDLNSGGTVHSTEELERVRGLLAAAAPAPDAGPLPCARRARP